MARVVTDDKHYRDIAAKIKSYDKAWEDSGVKPAEMAGAVDDVYGVGKIDGYVEAQLDEQAIYNRGLAAGKQAEYDRFWDNYQDHGNRTNYVYAFARNGWTDETFKPKYDIKPVGDTCNQTFAYSYMTNIAQSLRDQGVVLDTSEAKYFQQMFQSCKSTELPTIDLSKATTAGNVFQQCTSLVKIEKIILSETTPTPSTMFGNCTALVDVVFEGIVSQSLDLRWCPLSRASLISVANVLSTAATATLTVKKTAVDAAFPDKTEWDALFADKPNWTITEA